MSRLLVTQYHTEVEKIIRYGGSKKETSMALQARVCLANSNMPMHHASQTEILKVSKAITGTFAAYDMYTRFFRWTSDHLGQNGNRSDFSC